MKQENLTAACDRILREAIESSLNEISAAMFARFGQSAAPQDWWKPDPGDPFWMLEASDGSWLKNKHSLLTTRDPAKALRYPDRWHADLVRRGLHGNGWHDFTPTEHAWCSPASVDTRPQDEDAAQTAASLASGAVPAEERGDALSHPSSKDSDHGTA